MKGIASPTRPLEAKRSRLTLLRTGKLESVTVTVVDTEFEFPDASAAVKETEYIPISFHERLMDEFLSADDSFQLQIQNETRWSSVLASQFNVMV